MRLTVGALRSHRRRGRGDQDPAPRGLVVAAWKVRRGRRSRCSCDPDRHPQQQAHAAGSLHQGRAISSAPSWPSRARRHRRPVQRDGQAAPAQSYWLKINVAFPARGGSGSGARQLESLTRPSRVTASYSPTTPTPLASPLAGFDHDELLADGQSTRTLTVALYDHFGAVIAWRRDADRQPHALAAPACAPSAPSRPR